VRDEFPQVRTFARSYQSHQLKFYKFLYYFSRSCYSVSFTEFLPICGLLSAGTEPGLSRQRNKSIYLSIYLNPEQFSYVSERVIFIRANECVQDDSASARSQKDITDKGRYHPNGGLRCSLRAPLPSAASRYLDFPEAREGFMERKKEGKFETKIVRRASNANDPSASISCACALACTRALAFTNKTQRCEAACDRHEINQVTGTSPFLVSSATLRPR